jgi:hypothetical protein
VSINGVEEPFFAIVLSAFGGGTPAAMAACISPAYFCAY